MVGRKRMDDGKRVTVSAKVPESVATLIDARRGSQSRSAWLAEAALFRLGIVPVPVTGHPVSRIIADERVPPVSLADALRASLVADERQPPGTVTVVAPQPEGPPQVQVVTGISEPALVKPVRPCKAPAEPKAALHPCCRHCGHGGPKSGHEHACTKC